MAAILSVIALAFKFITTSETSPLADTIFIHFIPIGIPPMQAALIRAELFGFPLRYIIQRFSALPAKAAIVPINLLYIGCFQVIAVTKGLDSTFGQSEFFGYLRIILTRKAQSAYGAFFFIRHVLLPRLKKEQPRRTAHIL